ncbi:MAG: hypothetical protein LBG64_02705 [Pseudomonadales bacterium]|jgi:hypothetical protein|nr:hypothetical protein [Pseudomonadales bacterium]
MNLNDWVLSEISTPMTILIAVVAITFTLFGPRIAMWLIIRCCKKFNTISLIAHLSPLLFVIVALLTSIFFGVGEWIISVGFIFFICFYSRMVFMVKNLPYEKVNDSKNSPADSN